MPTLHRPAKLKLTAADKAAVLATLKTVLVPGQRLVFVQSRPLDQPLDWIVLYSNTRTGHGEIHNCSYEVAALLNRQCGDSRILRGWAYDSPRGLVKELIDLLGFPLSVDTL